MIPSALALALLAVAGPSFEVVPGGAGRNRLDVTPALLSASARGDLADLRLRDAQEREVPYLLVPPPDPSPRWVRAARVSPIPVDKKKKESGAELDLGSAREVAGLRLDVPAAASFIRSLRVEGSIDGARWTTLLAEGAIYALEREGCAPPACGPWLRSDEVRFEPATVRRLRVVFDDRRAPPLPPLRGAEALLAADREPEGGPVVPLALARRDGEPAVSRFAVVLPGPHLPVRAIRLDVDARHLFRSARVLESRLEGGRLVPHELGRGQLVRIERDGVTVAALRIEVTRPEEQELELVVEDGDGAPLALRGAVAELAPLPWVFFESADGVPLVATAGDAELRAPRYDLEAVRPELARGGAAGPRASWVMGVARLESAPRAAARPTPEPATGDAALPGAPLDTGAFRIVRTVAAAEPGLAAVRLDAAVLAESPDLADIRLSAPDGRQIPYLAESRPEPLSVPLAALRPARGGDAGRPPRRDGACAPARVRLCAGVAARARDVRARLHPHRPRLRGERGRPVRRAQPDRAGRVVARRSGPGRPSAHHRPARAPRRAAPRRARRRGQRASAALVRDAPPARVSPALLPPGPELRLLQGASGLSPPRYDLALLAPRLRAAPAREVALGPAPAAGRRLPSARTAFWAVLGGAVVGLLALVARLVRAPGSPTPPAG